MTSNRSVQSIFNENDVTEIVNAMRKSSEASVKITGNKFFYDMTDDSEHLNITKLADLLLAHIGRACGAKEFKEMSKKNINQWIENINTYTNLKFKEGQSDEWYPFTFFIACKRVVSKLSMLCIDHSCHVSVVIPMYNEQQRMQPKVKHFIFNICYIFLTNFCCQFFKT